MNTIGSQFRATRSARTTGTQVRWWGASILSCVVTLVGGIAALLTGEPVTVAVCLFAMTVVVGTSRLQARDEFRRGWRYGYESAVRVAIEGKAGRTTDIEARATVNGDPTPEPWERHVPPALPRRSS